MTDAIAAITDFDPSATSAIYDELAESWELNQDFAEMNLQVLREGRHLDSFGSGSSGEAAGQTMS